MNLSQDLAEVLIKNPNSVETLIKYVKDLNQHSFKFVFNGELDLNLYPNLIFSNEIIEGSIEHFIHKQITLYLTELNSIQDQVFRCQPWLKLNQNLYKEDYRRFDLTGQNFEENKFFDIPVKFIPVSFSSNMLVPKELWMLFNLSFPEISTVFGFFQTEDSTFVVVQRYPFKLEQLVSNGAKREEIASVFKQLVSLAAILHSKQVFAFRFTVNDVEVDEDGGIKVWDFSNAVLLSEFDGRRLEFITEDLRNIGLFAKEVFLLSEVIAQDDLMMGLAEKLANSRSFEETSEILQILFNENL